MGAPPTRPVRSQNPTVTGIPVVQPKRLVKFPSSVGAGDAWDFNSEKILAKAGSTVKVKDTDCTRDPTQAIHIHAGKKTQRGVPDTLCAL